MDMHSRATTSLVSARGLPTWTWSSSPTWRPCRVVHHGGQVSGSTAYERFMLVVPHIVPGVGGRRWRPLHGTEVPHRHEPGAGPPPVAAPPDLSLIHISEPTRLGMI